MTDKAAWRRWARAIRRPPTAEEQRGVVEAVATFLADVDGVILTFQAMSHELDLAPLLDIVPVDRLATTRTPETGPLTVHRIDGPMERHRFGFDQPVPDAPTVDLASVHMVLVPGVLFGRDGSRLGNGMGYYDRLLAACRDDVVRVAVTRSDLVVASVPVDEHDVAMTHLATELGVTIV